MYGVSQGQCFELTVVGYGAVLYIVVGVWSVEIIEGWRWAAMREKLHIL